MPDGSPYAALIVERYLKRLTGEKPAPAQGIDVLHCDVDQNLVLPGLLRALDAKLAQRILLQPNVDNKPSVYKLRNERKMSRLYALVDVARDHPAFEEIVAQKVKEAALLGAGQSGADGKASAQVAAGAYSVYGQLGVSDSARPHIREIAAARIYDFFTSVNLNHEDASRLAAGIPEVSDEHFYQRQDKQLYTVLLHRHDLEAFVTELSKDDESRNWMLEKVMEHSLREVDYETRKWQVDPGQKAPNTGRAGAFMNDMNNVLHQGVEERALNDHEARLRVKENVAKAVSLRGSPYLDLV